MNGRYFQSIINEVQDNQFQTGLGQTSFTYVMDHDLVT